MMADMPEVNYKGRMRPAIDVISDVEWDINHGNRDSAREGLTALQHAALETDNTFLRAACSHLYAMLDNDLPPRSADVEQLAASPANLPTPQPVKLTEEQELQFFRLAMRRVMNLKWKDTDKWVFNSKSLWKAPFRYAVDIGLLPNSDNEYAEFDKLAKKLGFNNPEVFRIPFSKSSIEDITQQHYAQFLKPAHSWTTEGLTGNSLSFAINMITVKNELKKRLEKFSVC